MPKSIWIFWGTLHSYLKVKCSLKSQLIKNCSIRFFEIDEFSVSVKKVRSLLLLSTQREGNSKGKDLQMRNFFHRIFFEFTFGTIRVFDSIDLSARPGTYHVISSFKYSGATSWYARKVRSRILNTIRCSAGSQCRSRRIGLIWCRIGIFVTILAAIFIILWIFLNLYFGTPYRTAFE